MRERGLTNADLARATRTPDATTSRWRLGRVRPSTASCKLIAEALGVPEREVLQRAGHFSDERIEVEESDPLEELERLVRRLIAAWRAIGSPPLTAVYTDLDGDDWRLDTLQVALVLPAGGHAGEATAGDLVLVERPGTPVEPGRYYLARINGQPTIARAVGRARGTRLEAPGGLATAQKALGEVVAYFPREARRRPGEGRGASMAPDA